MTKLLKVVPVLGVPYSIYQGTTVDCPDLCDCDGFCDTTIKQIMVFDPMEVSGRPGAKADLANYQRKVIRHELIHAILFECGLSNNSPWAENEEMVDWVAIQFPKLLAMFNAAECLGEGD